MKSTCLTLLLLLFFSTAFKSPVVMITGKVTSAEDGSALPGVNVIEKGTRNGTITNEKGEYSIHVQSEKSVLVFSIIGLKTSEVSVGNRKNVNVSLALDVSQLSEVVVTGYGGKIKNREAKRIRAEDESVAYYHNAPAHHFHHQYTPQPNTEEYANIVENGFQDPTVKPLSTFSIDVDKASYSNVRRFINSGQMPPKDAVRIEELINYFEYDYPQPDREHPFSITTELTRAPWNKERQLVLVGLQGKKIDSHELPASNLVFLIDVSGSMSDQNKLPLLKTSFKMLVNELRPQDKIAIVVYAGAAGLVLPSTAGNEKEKIVAALDHLQAGGSTAGGAGIQLAYKIAKENFVKEGNNRVILATDGDFNVGASSDKDMEQLIEEERKSGVFLTVLGFGMGNYKDAKMEILADKGNGNYAYIDNVSEARKTLVNEFGGTLFTIAKDVKLQVEFNPAYVKSYRLIGYENRLLKDEDFNNDKKDAGELGSGHTVTALYEIIPTKSNERPLIDDLKYQNKKVISGNENGELLTVKFRYKKPDEDTSKLLVNVLSAKETNINEASRNVKWSAAVAGFGMLLRG
ncbi:MAG: von Willebrand factor type A domain-containing protein, partial [Cyclobacteriaceae bacterium]|nr:von Willebrand factor type A domain-containing protein [Cyclobacteriaceae bacterium]